MVLIQSQKVMEMSISLVNEAMTTLNLSTTALRESKHLFLKPILRISRQTISTGFISGVRGGNRKNEIL
jgi:hypothetical protein